MSQAIGVDRCTPAYFIPPPATRIGLRNHRPIVIALLAASLLHTVILLLPSPGGKSTRVPLPVLNIELQEKGWSEASSEFAMPPSSRETMPTSQPHNLSTPVPRLRTGTDKTAPVKPQAATPEPGNQNPPGVNSAPRAQAPAQAPNSDPPKVNTLIELGNGAKARPTVFDPRLAERLSQERAKVPKFKKPSAEYMTTTGTFVQNGDSCSERRALVPSDIDSNVTQAFNIKCTKRRRPQADIDRLAEKYGIP